MIIILLILSLLLIAQSPYDLGQDRGFDAYTSTDTHFATKTDKEVDNLEKEVTKLQSEVAHLKSILLWVLGIMGALLIQFVAWAGGYIMKKIKLGIIILAFLVVAGLLFIRPQPAKCIFCEQFECLRAEHCVEQSNGHCDVCNTWQLDKNSLNLYRCSD